MGSFDGKNPDDIISSFLNEKICRDCKKSFIPVSIEDDLCDECKKKREDIFGGLFGKNSSDESATILEPADETVLESSSAEATIAETVFEEQTNPTKSEENSFSQGGMLLNTYRVDSDPIQGGMGSVWRVHHQSWDVDLAMKRPKKEFFTTEKQKETFIRECESWINLGLHPNIVSCYYVREIDGIPTIFSEWMENGDLESHIQDESLYEGSKEEVQKRLLDIAIQFAAGLNFAHEKGLIHQDVKPANLLISNNWNAKVSDFGLASACSALTILEGEWTVREDNPAATVISKSGGKTPAYCSPEQANSQSLSRRTDIYSWAVSVLEMYIGSKPWAHGMELTGPMVGSVCFEYFEMSRVYMPQTIKDILAKCLSQNPNDRYHDFTEIEKVLKNEYFTLTNEPYLRPEPNPAVETADSMNNKALSYLDLGKDDEAQRIWQKAVLTDPSNSKVLYNKCLYEIRKGNLSYEDAIRYLKINWFNNKMSDEAIILLEYIVLDGNDSELYSDLLWEFKEEFRDPKTIEYLENYLNKEDNNAHYELSVIKSIEELDLLEAQYSKAENEIEKLIDKGDLNEAALQMLAARSDSILKDCVNRPQWLKINEQIGKKCVRTFADSYWISYVIPGTGNNENTSFSADSSLLLCGNRLFNAHTGELLADNSNGIDDDKYIFSGISPNGLFYLRAEKGESGFQKIEAKTGKILCICKDDPSETSFLTISPDGQFLVSADAIGMIFFFSVDGKKMKNYWIQDGRIEWVGIRYDNKSLIAKSKHYIQEMKLDSTKINIITDYSGYADISVNSQYDRMTFALGHGGLASYNFETDQAQINQDELMPEFEYVLKSCFFPNDRIIVFADREKLFFYYLDENITLDGLDAGEEITGISLSRDGKYLAVSTPRQIEVWRIEYVYFTAPDDRKLKEYIIKEAEVFYDKNPRHSVKDYCETIETYVQMYKIKDSKLQKFLVPYAWVCSAANRGIDTDKLLPLFIEELSERGFGWVSESVAKNVLKMVIKEQKK